MIQFDETKESEKKTKQKQKKQSTLAPNEPSPLLSFHQSLAVGVFCDRMEVDWKANVKTQRKQQKKIRM